MGDDSCGRAIQRTTRSRAVPRHRGQRFRPSGPVHDNRFERGPRVIDVRPVTPGVAVSGVIHLLVGLRSFVVAQVGGPGTRISDFLEGFRRELLLAGLLWGLPGPSSRPVHIVR